MRTRWIQIRVDERLYEQVRDAAVADRRSLSNWVALTIERALKQDRREEQPSEAAT